MNKTTHGGKREGAGRPLSTNPKKLRSIKATDEEWSKIKELAAIKGISANEYIIKSALKQVDN